MKKNIVIKILSIFLLVLISFIVYDKVNEKSANTTTKCEKEELEAEKDNGQIVEKELVYDLVNGKVIQTFVSKEYDIELEDDEIPYIDAAIPYVNIDTEGAKELNDKIQKDYSKEIDVIKNNITEQTNNKGPYYEIINYSYTERDDILFIFIETKSVAYRAGGGINNRAYYFDIENDKMLSAQEVLKKLGTTKENIVKDIIDSLTDPEMDIKELKYMLQNDFENEVSLFVVGNRLFVIPKNSYIFETLDLFID